MSAGAPKKGSLVVARTVGLIAAGWALVSFLDGPYSVDFFTLLDRVTNRVLSGFPAAEVFAQHLGFWALATFAITYVFILAGATLLAPLGFVARMLARARIRAGHADFLDRLRGWTAKHPGWTRALLALPGALVCIRVSTPGHYELQQLRNFLLVVAFTQPLAVWAMYAMARRGLRALLAPTLDGGDAEARFAIAPDEIAFDAVAVTREARAAIASVGALSVLVTGWLATRPILTLFHDRLPFYVMLAYAAVAAGAAFAFRKASRVAVGVDGVLVKGTSRTRFFAYRDLEAARVSSGALELVRKGKVILRLQLHGADALRRDAVLARVRQHVDRVKEGKDAVAAQLVASSSQEQLTRVASGGADYRAASLSREALWALVEGPSVDGEARRAAAEAIVKSGDAGERRRVRVAAERCADPRVRVALEALVDGDAEADAEAKAVGSVAARRTA